MGRSKVLMCVLMLGLVLELAQVEGKSCCRNTSARLCYNTCRFPTPKPPREFCAKLCDCIIQSSPTCRPPYPSFNLFPDSEEQVSIQYCSTGCRSSVCDNMSNDAVDGSKGMETIVERCGKGCDQFCKGYGSIGSSVAA
ncbi:hypothetical protein EJB05_35073, partial [Eragrostis curvula]